jgi:hypothetical protein
VKSESTDSKRSDKMKRKFKRASLPFGFVAVCLLAVQGLQAQPARLTTFWSGFSNYSELTGASTGCGYYTSGAPLRPKDSPSQGTDDSGRSLPLLVSGHEPDGDSDLAPIVGLWKFKFVSKDSRGIPDDTVIDEGYATWHSDGTEIMNSGRAPMTSNFCMGVWKKTRRSTYKLNHFGLSWDPAGTFFIGPANIKEEVTLDNKGNRYFGTFTIDQFDTSGNLLGHVAGLVTAERITAD